MNLSPEHILCGLQVCQWAGPPLASPTFFLHFVRTAVHELAAFLGAHGLAIYNLYDLHSAEDGQLIYADAVFIRHALCRQRPHTAWLRGLAQSQRFQRKNESIPPMTTTIAATITQNASDVPSPG